jgi:hypothetical protein
LKTPNQCPQHRQIYVSEPGSCGSQIIRWQKKKKNFSTPQESVLLPPAGGKSLTTHFCCAKVFRSFLHREVHGKKNHSGRPSVLASWIRLDLNSPSEQNLQMRKRARSKLTLLFPSQESRGEWCLDASETTGFFNRNLAVVERESDGKREETVCMCVYVCVCVCVCVCVSRFTTSLWRFTFPNKKKCLRFASPRLSG